MPIKKSQGTFLMAFTSDGRRSTTKLLSVNPKWHVPKVGKILYSGRYPITKSRIIDNDLSINIEIEAFSTVIPHDVKNSSLPLALFYIRLKNKLKRPVEVAIAFSLENFLGVGGLRTWGQHRQNLYWNDRSGNFQQNFENDMIKGLHFITKQKQTGQRKNCIGEYGLFFKKDTDIDISTCEHWNANPDDSDLQELFTAFSENGTLNLGLTNDVLDGYIEPWEERDITVHTAGAIAAKCTIKPQAEKQLLCGLSWYMPHFIQLDETDVGHMYNNYYSSAIEIGHYGIKKANELYTHTDEWQQLLFQSNLPQWYIRKIINDSFTTSTNTVLTKEGLFTNIESPYHMGGCLGTMDQKLVAHIFYHLFFPELDKAELLLFAKNQQPDGSITHMIGSLQGYIGKLEDSAYQITHWPDLIASFVWQIYKFYIWTGEVSFLDEMKSYIFKATDWLITSDQDGDNLPEGGSTWDNKHYKGAFVYNASVSMVALTLSIKIAKQYGERQREEQYVQALENMKASFIKVLYNGCYFNKFYDPVSKEKSEYCFTSQLAGEWMRQLVGLDKFLPESMVRSTLENIYNLTEKFDLPPIETAPDGTIIPERYKGYNVSWPRYAETFICANGFYYGLADKAVQKIKRINDAMIHLNRNIWNFRLFYNAETGLSKCHAHYYMSSAASWFGYLALIGLKVNWPQKQIEFSPNLPAEMDTLNAPLFLPNIWIDVTYYQNHSNINIGFNIIKLFGENHDIKTFYIKNTLDHDPTSVLFSFNQKFQRVQWELKDDKLFITLNTDIRLSLNDTINIKIK